MSAPTMVPAPPPGVAHRTRYAIKPREKRSFHTVLDASRLISAAHGAESVADLSRDGDTLRLVLEHGAMGGRIREVVEADASGAGLRVRSLERQVFDERGEAMRHERVVQLHHGSLGLPDATYPEVALPFLLGWLPLHERRSLFAWINDRFVARVYVEEVGDTTVLLPGGRRDAREVEMYPDLNDWVRLGTVLTKLAKPFLPRYRMWFEPAAPHRLLRFEGPYGPPGAPEIVLEWLG